MASLTPDVSLVAAHQGRVGALSFFLACLMTSGALAQAPAAPPDNCPEGISPETADRLAAILSAPLPSDSHCRLHSVETKKSLLEAQWSESGRLLPPVRVIPINCGPREPGAIRAGRFNVLVPAELRSACPAVGALLDHFSSAITEESPVHESNEAPSLTDPLLVAATIVFCLCLLLLIADALQSWQGVRLHRARLAVGTGGFALALVLSASVPFSLGNWYSEVLPAAGPPPWMRFGPGSFAFELMLRAVGLWGQPGLVVSQLLLGALAIPILVGILSELQVGLWASAAAAGLLAIAPFHVRLAASSSEHVLASTLALAMLWMWLRALRRGSWLELGLTILLFGAVCLTRIEMMLQAAMFAAWPVFRDAIERDATGGSKRRRMIAAFAVVALVVVGVCYVLIALPSHHPTPDFESMGWIARNQVVQQFWRLSHQAPRWISLSSVLLAPVGVAWMSWKRPVLLARVLVTLACAFLGLGRTFLHDELLSARYFLAMIPVFLILSGFGFEALVSVVPARARTFAAVPALLAILVWTGLAAREANATTYAFQDEYGFLREALKALPAGCVVYELPIRAMQVPQDMDCCLDVPRTPLPLEFPQLRFDAVPPEPATVFETGSCRAYYESVACDFKPGEEGMLRHSKAVSFFRDRCAAVRRTGHLQPLSETTTSSRSTFGLFEGGPPHAGLYRWTPP